MYNIQDINIFMKHLVRINYNSQNKFKSYKQIHKNVSLNLLYYKQFKFALNETKQR